MTPSFASEVRAKMRGRVLVVTGAGVSAESNIPTFRGPDGHWRNLDPMQLATPEAFHRDPELVWTWYDERRQKIRQARPNPAHHTIATLAGLSRDFLLLTQNVDDLHERGGSPPETIVHIHGDIFVTRCSRCDHWTREDITVLPPPRCSTCGYLMRPGVVWFGEQLDVALIERVEQFLRDPVDLVLAVGTTAVFPYIIRWMTRGRLLVEINPEETAASQYANHVIRRPAGEALPELVVPS